MPQFNNLNYNSLQLQSKNEPNGIIQPNLNNNNSHAFFSFTNSNDSNNRIIYNSTHSQSEILTPGRKSASPTFFHSNESLYTRHLNHGHVNFFNSAYNNKHLNLNCPQNQFPFPNLNGHQLPLLNQHDSMLKIPTTPTRSKSLSPSLRFVNQPARLRHKQQNKNSTNFEQNQFLTTNNGIKRQEYIKNSVNNENFCFQPINNLTLKNIKSESLKSLEESNVEVNKISLKFNESNEKIQIKKPIPVLPICHTNDPFFVSSKQQNIFVDKSNKNKKIISTKVSTEINNLKNSIFQKNDFLEGKNQKFVSRIFFNFNFNFYFILLVNLINFLNK